jgi:acyl-CoA synthetase (AMP-forming)/AMP-acid ligase II/tetratricopeptide (TPR) repeat protein/acyl carrier protein
MPPVFGHALREAVGRSSDGRFEVADESRVISLTYADAFFEAGKILAGLRSLGCRPGHRLILDASDVSSFIPTMWASLAGGMVAAPIKPTLWNSAGEGEFHERLAGLVQALEDPIVVCADERLFRCGTCRLSSYELLRSSAESEEFEPVQSEGSAALILTSGTTGRFQLVSLSASAVMHRWWPSGAAISAQSSLLSWMPLDHVMGLSFASPNHNLKVHLSAESFLRSPTRWLELLAGKRITHATMTNFGMRLIVDAAGSRNDWDLSHLKMVGVGAETISPNVCANFVELLRRLGAANVVTPGYGLSECGPLAGGRPYVGVPPGIEDIAPLPIDGPTPGHSIRIVDEEGRLCQEGEIGEIEACGPTMTSGYYGDPAANERLFTPDGWIRTGDLGRLDGGCLTVFGRKKEVLVINARKFGIAEIEEAIQKVPGVAAAYVASLDPESRGGRRVAVAYVSSSPSPALEALMRKAVVDNFGFGFALCHNIDPDAVPRTANGKLQRYKLAEILASAQSIAIAKKPDLGADPESKVRSILSRFLGGIVPAPEDSFFDLGGDSLSAVLASAAIEKELATSLSPVEFTINPTAKAISRHISEGRAQGSRVSVVCAQRGLRANNAIFLAPGLYGNNGYAVELAEALGDDLGVMTFHLRSYTDESRFESVSVLGRECALAMQSIQPTGPYFIAGYSFGGLVAYEIARHLRSVGASVGMLAIIDQLAPVHLRRHASAGTSPSGSISQHHRFLAASYVPVASDVRVQYFRAQHSPHACLSDLSGGWSYLASGGVDCYEASGEHATIFGYSCDTLAKAILGIMDGVHDGIYIETQDIPTECRSLVAKASGAFIRGDVAEESARLRDAIRIDPDLPYWVYARLTEALLSAKHLDAAITTYTATLQRDARPLATQSRFIKELLDNCLIDLALSALEAANRTQVDSVASAYTKARILFAFREWDALLNCIRSGIAIFPEGLEMRTWLVRVLTSLGRRNEALIELNSALVSRSGDEILWRHLGNAALRLNDISLAMLCLKRSDEINPGDSVTLTTLAKIARFRGDVPASTHYEQRARDLEAERQTEPEAKGARQER